MKCVTSIPRIYADERGLKHHDLTEKLIGIFYTIYNELGHGFSNQCMSKPFQLPWPRAKSFSNARLQCQCGFMARRSETFALTC